VPNKDIKVLLISDATKFALTDVYYGYKHAFNQLKIPFETFPYHNFRKITADEICYHVMHSTALIKSKGFTHVMLIGGLNIPQFMFDSLYHIKSIVVSTEDPHSFDPLKHRLNHIDYYFSNERSIGESEKYKNTYYCPTAASPHECGFLPLEVLEDGYKSDILFLGALYPNRRKYLEALIPLVKKHKLSYKICGHVQYLPKKSPLWEYVYDQRTIPHHETVKYYNGAKISLNILRDIKWNPRTKSEKNPYNKSRFKAESLNPRAYEVPLCQSFMLLEDIRAEGKEIFNTNEVGFFSDEASLIKKTKYYLLGAGAKKREEMAFNAYKKVAQNHTYINRLAYIRDIITNAETC